MFVMKCKCGKDLYFESSVATELAYRYSEKP